MRHVDEYRDPELARRLLEEIRSFRREEPWVIMEVCGGQTHSLLRYGLDEALAGIVELIHGPGCPVCVTPSEVIDFAIWLCQRPGVILATFGDMLRVPGSSKSLSQARSKSGSTAGDIKVVYSPVDAVRLAERNPDKHVVFLAVGFETTAPSTALAVLQAEARGVENFSLLAAHVRVQPAMEMLAQSADARVQGFLAAGHVCTITGFHSYEAFASKHRLPVVVTGFEPVDLLLGVRECLQLLTNETPEVLNCYVRNVTRAGNSEAQRIVDAVYEPADTPWRGMGIVPRGGLKLRPRWKQFDARTRFPEWEAPALVNVQQCLSGEVLSGRIKPPECPKFRTECTPHNPLGPPMVSNEGACAAYFRYAIPGVRQTSQ